MNWVLIVEDHALFREGLALLLKWRTGLDNVQSGSIAETRRILGDAEEEPVCAVVDLDLPDGVGLQYISDEVAFERGRHKLERADSVGPGASIAETLCPGFAVGLRVLRRTRIGLNR
jgi:hypothetical protein